MLNQQKIINGHKDLEQIEELYNVSFPKEERAPFSILLDRINDDRGELIAYYQEDVFVGFAYIVNKDDICFIFYLAVSPKFQGRGFGSEILSLIKEKYSSKAVCLNIETLDEDAPNYEQRIRRAKFYERNGFKDLHYTSKDGGIYYEMFAYNGEVSKEEYTELLSNFFGKELYQAILEKYS